MKRFQSIIQKYITNHERHKKYLAGVLALSVLVSFGVSAGLIMPAISMTEDDVYNATPLSMGRAGEQMLDNYAGTDGNKVNDFTYSPAQRSVKELLIGSTDGNALSWANGAETPSAIAKRAEDTYFLGIAYDFCLFLEGTATLQAADAEGRVAVGGNLIFDGGYCYQVGAGNFGYMTALKDTDDYQGISGFANAIVGGYMKNIHPLSTGNNKTRVNSNAESKGGHQGFGETLYFPPTEDEFKRFVVGDATENSDATHMHCASGAKYNVNGSHDDVSVNELAEMYRQPQGNIIDFENTFIWLRERSAALGEKKATGTVSTDGNKVTFTIPQGMENADTIYFDLPDGVDYSKLDEINFVNVPKETTEMVVRETESDELKTVTKNIPKCNLVINGLGESFNIRGTENTAKTTITYTDGTVDEISNTRDASKRDEYNKNTYHSNADPEVIGWRSNNHPASSKILYNFPNATTGTINGNFNGTIFAPNADVTSDQGCTGHLSGALIAKSFKGGLEFGYRPYRGTSDILGSKSGYGVPIKKIIAGTDTALEGATFGVFKGDSETPETTFTSDADGNGYVNIPSQVDFSGDTDYTSNNILEATYKIKEIDAPSGFVKEDTTTYEITVTETVNETKLIDNKPIPIKVTTTITQGTESFTIVLNDIYSYDNGTYKRIRRELKIYSGENVDGELKDTFFMDVDGDGKVTSVMRVGDNLIGEKLTQYIPTDDTTWEVQDDTKKLNATEYISKSDITEDTSNITVYKDGENYYYITNTTNENGETVTSEPVSITSSTFVYKVTSSENYRFVRSGESSDEGVETSGDVFVNSAGYLTDVDSEDDLIEVKKKVVEEVDDELKDEDVNGKTAYNIGQIAWNNETFPTVNKLTFYYSDKTSQSKTNVNITGSGNWRNFDLSDLITSNVVGIKIITSGDNKAKLCVQGTDNNNISALCAFGDNDSGVNGTICLGLTPSTHEETSYQDTSTQIQVKYAVQKSVLDKIEHDCYTPICSGEAAQAARDYQNNGVNYKYDPDTVMMMPQPTATQTFENKRGLIFKKVGKSGNEEATALKGATIAVKEHSGWGTGDDADKPTGTVIADMSNILSGGSETTVDLNDIAENKLYYFEETTAPEGYEIASPIYFKKSGNTIYYTTEIDTAKSDVPGKWETVDLTKNSTNEQACITMTDIKVSGAKIKLSKWNVDFNTRLGGAKFQLCLSDGTTPIYPLGNESFTIDKDTDFDLYETLKDANPDTYNPEYIKNGYLKPGTYVLKEVAPPTGYNAQDFKFNVKAGANGTYEIKAVSSAKADEGDMYLSTGDGNPVLIITGRLLEMAKENPDENFIENLWKVNQVHVSSDGNGWGGNLNISNKSSYTFKEILDASGKSADAIKFIRFMQWDDKNKPYNEATSPYYDGNPTGSGSDSSGSSIQSHTIHKIKIKSGSNFNVTFYYADKDPVSKQNLSLDNEGCINISDFDKNNVIGIEVTNAEGQSNGKVEWIQNSSYNVIFGTNYNTEYDLGLFGERNNAVTTTTTSASDSDVTETTTVSSLTVAIDNQDSVNIIKIPNQRAGATMSVSVEKVWANDTGFESLRKQISVTLKRRVPDASGQYVDDESFTDNKYTITLDGTVDSIEKEAWKASWSNLERLVEGTENTYKYYVVENITGDEYEISYSDNNTNGIDATGTITITNTLPKDTIDITKKWEVAADATAPSKPDKLNVTLKFTIGDVSKTQTVELTPKNNSADYTGSFDIPKGATNVSVEENSVPSGWKLKDDGITGNIENGFIIINVPDSGSLKVEKHWDDDNATNKRPNQIQIAIYRTTQANSSGTGSNNSEIAYGASHFNPNTVNNLVPDYASSFYTNEALNNGQTVNQFNDYARLLQYSLYFYDANMCGSDVGRASEYDWRDACHTYDGNYSGGFHDAGDHVMFGLPQGFSASTLGWSYYEFKNSFDKLGLTDHYQEIMKEFCDFFVKSTKMSDGNVSQLLVQKGDGGTDHSKGWVSPEEQSQDKRGGLVWTSNSGSNVAADYAAALAQYYLNFPNDPNRDQYLEYAKALYSFSTTRNSCTSPGEYSDNECNSEQAWAAAWLYLATNDDSYKTACKQKLDNLTVPARGHFWGDVTLGAAAVYTTLIDPTDNAIKSKVTGYLNTKCQGTDFVVVDSESGNWGSVRHNALAQTVALIYDKHQDSPSYTEWAKEQMAYILGKNNVASNGKSSTCFVTGFADNSPINLHHRAASNLHDNDDWSQWNSWNGEYSNINGSHIIVGALVGGNGNNSGYKDNCKDHVGNEVALDYNAGLVAAAAGLYDAYGTGKTYANDGTSYTPQAQNDISAQSYNAPYAQTYDAEPQSDDMSAEEPEEDVLDGITLDNPTVDVEAGEEVLLKSVILAKNTSNNTTNVISQFDTVKNVKRIEFKYVFNESVTGAGAGPIKYNNNISLFDEEWNEFDKSSDGKICTKSYNVSNVDVSSINLGKIYWWNNSPSEMSLIVNFYGEDTGIQITSSKEITISEGSAATITANKSATWSISSCDNAVVFDGTYENTDTVNIRANSYYNGDVTITATSLDGTTNTVTVTITGADIQILEGTDDVGNSIKIHKGTIRTVTLLPADGDVTVDVADENIVTVTPESAQFNANFSAIPLPTGRCNIIAGNTTGNTNVTFTRNGVSKIINVEVINDLQINGNAKMNANSEQQLTVENAVGNVWWEVVEGNDYIEIDASTGKVTSKGTTGVTATVKAIDSDNKEATFTITIDLTAVEPDIPNIDNLKPYKIITLTKDEGWKTEVSNLPKTDANGKDYCYYIVELDSTGKPATSIKGTGNGVEYVPVKYEGNGAVLTGNTPTLSVTNEKKPETETPGYTLPSAGGKGADWYYIIGAGLMSGAVVMWVRRRRRSA